MKLITVLASWASAAAAIDLTVGRPNVRAALTGLKYGTFEQLLNHSDPSQGTFSQRYVYNDEYYQGPGSPIVLTSSGEQPIYEPQSTNGSLSGAMAQAIGGATIQLEHRYYGQSSPFTVLDTKNLQHLNINNTIADYVHFAKTVKLPFDPQGSSSPDKAPWVYIGGSYGGSLAVWTEVLQPGTFWAYHGSSAVVETLLDYSAFFYPIAQGLPQNCSRDLDLVMRHVDDVFDTGSADDKLKLKTLMGLQDVEHDDDFIAFLARVVSSWQRVQTSPYWETYWLCDSVEGVFNQTNPTLPGPEGVGLEKALAGYANYVSWRWATGYCVRHFGKYTTDLHDVSCLNSHNASSPRFADMDVVNMANRQWQWLLCNDPFAMFQAGTPNPTDPNAPRIVSPKITPDYWQSQCARFFPEQDGYTYGLAAGKTVEQMNQWTGGWDQRNRTRVSFTNGEFDTWRNGGVSSDFRPGGPQQSTADQPVNVIKGGVHCFDWWMQNTGDPNVKTVVDAEIAQIKQWVSEFKPAA